MRHILLILSVATILRAGHNFGAHVEYVGGTRADIPNGAGGTIEAKQGTIVARNRADRNGAVFTIRLPIPAGVARLDSAA